MKSFLQQKHTIKKRPIEISQMIVDELPKFEDNDDITSDMIEVTGEDVSNTDILEIYFQGVKSGGQREKEVEWIKHVKHGVVHVKFMSSLGMFNMNIPTIVCGLECFMACRAILMIAFRWG